MTEATAFHEGAHLVVALALGLPVRSASIAPGRARVELGDLGASVRTFACLRRCAVVAGAGPMADRCFDSRGWDGYVWTDASNDLHKVATIAAFSTGVLGRRLDAGDVLREADEIVWRFRPLVAEAAQALATAQTLDGRLLAQLAPRLGAGLLAERFNREAHR